MRLRCILILLFILGQWVTVTPVHAQEKKGTNSQISVVVIDPGHGGRDPGANIGSAQEKDIVLDIALQLGEQIETKYPDVRVIYTRNSDVFIPLHKRAAIANSNNADLFISIHVNSVSAKSVYGAETFVLGLHSNQENLEVAQTENAAILLEDNYQETYEDFDPNSDESYIMFANMQEEFQNQSIKMAAYIQDEFRTFAKRSDRSVKMAGFLVLRQTSMPSVLIETGFLSHTNERNYLLSQSGRKDLATSIFRAFCLYKAEIEEHSTFSLSESTSVSETKEELQKEGEPAMIVSPEKTIEEALIEKKDIYFSVQIMALTKKLNTSPENFKGEHTVFRVDDTNISRYFVGYYKSYQEALDEQSRVSQKFENAFVVAFENNKLISVKKALEEN